MAVALSDGAAKRPNELDPPAELIEVRAFFKWKRRCEVGGEIHGGHKKDWYEAEKELRQIWRRIDVADLLTLIKEMQSAEIDIDVEAVRKRAYFNWLHRCQGLTAVPWGDPGRDWQDAEHVELTKQFAGLFLGTLSNVLRGDGNNAVYDEVRRDLRVIWPDAEAG
jgi:hypothetical protein